MAWTRDALTRGQVSAVSGRPAAAYLERLGQEEALLNVVVLRGRRLHVLDAREAGIHATILLNRLR